MLYLLNVTVNRGGDHSVVNIPQVVPGPRFTCRFAMVHPATGWDQ
jgi:hypothetical protein